MEDRLLESLLDRFKELLDREEDLCTDLISLCEKEQRAILEWCASDLIVYTREKEELVLNLGNVQNQREQVLGQLREILGFGETVPVSEIAGALDDPFSRWLQAAASRFEAAGSRLAQLNERNKRLLADGLRVIRGACELVKNASGFNSIYKSSGTMCSHGGNGRFLRGKA